MEHHHFKSVIVSRIDSSAATTVPFPLPSACPVGPSSAVSTKPLSFSISKILGLEETAASTNEHSLNSVVVDTENAYKPGYQTPCSCGSCNGASPRSSPSFIYSSSGSDSEPDQLPTYSELSLKRHRATFSPIKVSELESAFKRQPYLLSKWEDELRVRKLRIPLKPMRSWFQNRRVKQGRQECERNTRDRHYRRIPSGAPQSTASQMHDKQAYFTKLFHRLENQPHLLHKPVPAENQHSCRSPIQSSQFRGSSDRYSQELNPDLSKFRLAMEPVRQPFRRMYHRYHPY